MSSYSIKSLYEVIRFNILLKDKDLIHFTRTMHNLIKQDFDKIKPNQYLTIYDISNVYENYTIVYMMIKGLMKNAKISNQNEKTLREITDLYLTDELSKTPPPLPQSSTYNDED